MRYPDLTGKLMIHAKNGGRLRVWKRISRYYYAVHFVYDSTIVGEPQPHFVAGIVRVGHLFHNFLEVIPNPEVVSWHALCNKYPEFDES